MRFLKKNRTRNFRESYRQPTQEEGYTREEGDGSLSRARFEAIPSLPPHATPRHATPKFREAATTPSSSRSKVS